MNSKNSFEMFLSQDINKQEVFRGFKKMNRDLTQAFLRKCDTKNLNPKQDEDA